MPTLYVRNVPAELYERLRREAASGRRSIGAEAVALLSRGLASHAGPTLEELLEEADRIRAENALPAGSPSAAELIREDRDR
jgi:plasmid stability protein